MDKIEPTTAAPESPELPPPESAGLAAPQTFAAAPSEGRGEVSLSRDFLTGCGTLVAAALIIFVLLPTILMVAEVSIHVAVPLAILAMALFFIALLGRAIRILRSRW